MKESAIIINNHTIRVITLNTVIVGSGAAGFNAADRLHQFGQKDIAIVTENVNAGTSRNTGSDKQTYYKLTLSGNEPDSVGEMAKTLFQGGAVDGDIALAEAAMSAQSFLRLAELGVKFPRNRYGEYIGYKTDHDPRRRATSVGPYTSKMMTECLERSVRGKNIKIYDNFQVVKILTNQDKLSGLLCIDIGNQEDRDKRFVAFNCSNVIYATGGPAGMYSASVYPIGHYGASGIAFEAGVRGKNLTEWQYGLASLNPRWNVSGTYMQVLPRFISTDSNGNNEREFLSDFFKDKGDMLTKIFLKGYQWPFDVRKIDGGSSIIDILVYIETCKGRRVFLDFQSNPGGRDIDYHSLSPEAREYLENAGACFGTPIERLLLMNAPAVDFYKDKGVDITRDPLEIALCAQHNNGGLAIDKWWQTNINGFFAAGEVSASHGVYRPGGSALNAGQVGSMRAAQYIAAKGTEKLVGINDFEKSVSSAISYVISIALKAIGKESNVDRLLLETTERMSRYGAAIRDIKGIIETAEEVWDLICNFSAKVSINSNKDLFKVFRLKDILISQYVYLSAMRDYMEQGGGSRGSSLYTDNKGRKPYEELPETFRYNLDDGRLYDMVQEVLYADNQCRFNWRKVREIPTEDDFFENVWRSYRENANIY